MFRNYLTIALRNIVRHKLYSFINIAGLAVGLACAIFIALFVRDEISYDKWIPDTENLYQLRATMRPPGLPPLVAAITPFPLAVFMKEHLPEVTGVTHFYERRMTVNVGDRQFAETVDEVDPNFFQVIKLPLVAGLPANVLAQPDSVVLTQSMARKYFGDADPVGKIISISKASCGPEHVACPAGEPLRVTGMMRDLPHNTHLAAGILIPNTSLVDTIGQEEKQAWFSINGFSYARLTPGADPAAVLAKLTPLLDRYVDLKKNSGLNLPASKAITVSMARFSDVHLSTSGLVGNMTSPGSWTTLYGLCLVGALILLVACFNFMNLATARATMRAREISLRKCVGASRRQLIAQFLGEAVLMALLALLFALAIVEILLPAYGRFLGRPIMFHYLDDWPFLLVMILLAMLVGLVSGSYPALILSGFRPAAVLRANSAGQGGSGVLRGLLVVLQFAVSIGLALIAFVVFLQIQYARHVDMGFRSDNIIAIDATRRMPLSQRESFANLLRGNPGVLGVAMSSDTPLSGSLNITGARVVGRPDETSLALLTITPDFPALYGMRVVAGRMLSSARGEDVVVNADKPSNENHNVMINEAAAARFGYTPQQAIGISLIVNGHRGRVVGVLNDAKVEGARQAVRPTIFLYDREDSSVLSVRLRPDRVSETLAFIDRNWHKFVPGAAITRSFISDNFEKLYRSEEKQGLLFTVFVGLAIFIACLGLFGLAAFTAGRRTKEIGIRKVFGARTRDVTLLLLWQFSIPVLLANLIAWPLAWYYLRDWLQQFAYRIALNPLYFGIIGLAALAIAWVTIFAHALRVARANPIHALRYE